MILLIHIARIFIGSIFLIFGLNGFYTLIPVPEFHPFMEILVSSGYIYLVKSVEVIGGILLLTNRFVPVAILILGFNIVNITVYHMLIDPRNLFIVPILWILLIPLLIGYWKYFTPILKFKAEPHIP